MPATDTSYDGWIDNRQAGGLRDVHGTDVF